MNNNKCYRVTLKYNLNTHHSAGWNIAFVFSTINVNTPHLFQNPLVRGCRFFNLRLNNKDYNDRLIVDNFHLRKRSKQMHQDKKFWSTVTASLKRNRKTSLNSGARIARIIIETALTNPSGENKLSTD